ncbi:MAG: nuclear transport factor 2 family protein [Actinomycetota bacterium]|nr:nuclear transport factor 2 family protein [Actinomycetota bacterium]
MAKNLVNSGFRKLLLGVLLLTIVASGLVGFITVESAKNMAEIEKVIRASVVAAKTLTQLPEPYCSDTEGKIPEKVKQEMFDKISAKYNEIYSSGSEIQGIRLENLRNSVVGQEADNFRSLGGGIKSFENMAISLDGDEATAEVDMTTFARLRESNGRIFTPEATAHYKFSLVKEDGRWKISKEEFDVLPGQI